MTIEKPRRKKVPFYQTWMTIVYDKDLQIVDIINPQHCMLLQLTADELLGMSVSELEQVTEGPNKEPARIIAKSVKKAILENRNVYFEYSTTHKDGTVTYAICYAEKGPKELLYVNVIKIDEENIFEARDGFTNYVINTTINNISVGVYMRHIQEDGTKPYILFNDVAKEFYESDNIQQSPHWNQQDEDIADAKTLELRDPLKIERVFRDGEGNISRWLIVTKKKIVSYAKGYYIITTIIDITKRRQNEILLEQQFALLDSMYEQLPVGIVIYDKDGKLISLNQKDMDMFGWKEKESVIGMSIFQEPNTPPDIKTRLLSGENVEYEMVYNFDADSDKCFHDQNRGIRIISVKLGIIKNKKGEVDGYLKICEDMTEKKKTEYQLNQKHKLIETIYNTIPIGIEVYDRAGRLIEINKYDMELMGVPSKDDVLGVSFFENPNISQEIKERTKQGEDLEYTIDYDFNQAQDYYHPTVTKKLHLNIKTSTIRDDNDNIDCYLLINQDRTAAVEHAKLLEETAAKLSTIFNTMSTGIEIYDKNGKLVDCNDFGLKIFGVEDKEDFMRRNEKLSSNPNISHENVERLLSGGELFFQTIYDFDIVREHSYYTTTKTGRVHLDVKASPMIIDRGELIGFIVEINDITKEILYKQDLERVHKQSEYSLSLLNNIIEKIPLSLFIKDVDDDYRYIIINEKLAELQKYAKADILGHTDYDLAEREIADLFRKEDEKVVAAAGAPLTTIKPVMMGGSLTIQKTTEALFTSVDGRQLLVGVIADVTEEYKEKQELQDYRTKTHLIIKACDIAQWDYDLAIKKTFSSHEKAVIPNKTFAVSEYLKFVHPDDETILTDFYAKMDARVDGNIEAQYRIKLPMREGYSDVIMNGTPLKNSDGVIISYTGLRRDMTEWNTINRQLVEERKKAEAADKLKSAFLANMSHEIRTPLNAIVGFSELLQTIDDNKEKKEYVNIINVNNELLLRLISDILDLSKIESGLMDLKPERFDLSTVFFDAYTALSTRCTNPDVVLQECNPYKKCMITLDKNRILQINANFVTNAIKYTLKGSISMGYEYINNGIRLYVKDTGIGVAQDKQNLLFQRFSKLDDFAQGTGLGLAICKAIVDVMNGEIGCESKVGEGSTFWAWIPCDAEIDE